MASIIGLIATVLIVLATAVGAAKEFKVGGAEGWRQPGVNQTSLYEQWAASNRFHVGDSLRFEYKNDSVVVVDKWGYYHCNRSNAITASNEGNSVVMLKSPGPIYFISGDVEHCKSGQRLVVDVMSPHPPISRTPPSIASPPHPYLPVVPSPSPWSPSSAGLPVPVTPISILVATAASLLALVGCEPCPLAA